MTCDSRTLPLVRLAVARDQQPAALELDADAGAGGVPRPVGLLHVLGDLDRLRPGRAVVGALRDPDGARALALAADDLRLGVACRGCGSAAARWCRSWRRRPGRGCRRCCRPSSQTTCVSPHVLPPSVLRFRSRSMSPVSPRPFLRPSQKASTVALRADDQRRDAVGVVAALARGEERGLHGLRGAGRERERAESPG